MGKYQNVACRNTQQAPQRHAVDESQHHGSCKTVRSLHRAANRGPEWLRAVQRVVGILPYFWSCLEQVRLIEASTMTIQLDANSFGSPFPPPTSSPSFTPDAHPPTALQVNSGLGQTAWCWIAYPVAWIVLKVSTSVHVLIAADLTTACWKSLLCTLHSTLLRCRSALPSHCDLDRPGLSRLVDYDDDDICKNPHCPWFVIAFAVAMAASRWMMQTKGISAGQRKGSGCVK